MACKRCIRDHDMLRVLDVTCNQGILQLTSGKCDFAKESTHSISLMFLSLGAHVYVIGWLFLFRAHRPSWVVVEMCQPPVCEV